MLWRRICEVFSYGNSYSNRLLASSSISSCYHILRLTGNRSFFLSTNDTMAAKEADTPKLNKLVNEKSSYLRQHASNPVYWYPWGNEAFEKAKKENKVIFLSVGYSTCHWCHVMERESFDNEQVAKVMNDNFVSIKVDREERPDVDKVYMLFVQAISGGGGWPMSVWLTPDLKPITGGTYFPPDDRYHDRPGFLSILNTIADQWKKDHLKVSQQGSNILDALSDVTVVSKSSAGNQIDVNFNEVMKLGLKQLTRGYEPEFGGFSKTPKFPQPVFFNFLYDHYFYNKTVSGGHQALDMTLTTLKMMAQGGIHDHVNQGFHRYSTDKEWHVPHFEKMLYDQAQLAVAYLTAYQITKEPLYEETTRGILSYVNRDLSDESGGFYSAEDADSFPNKDSKLKKEGAFCVWTKDEIDSNLSAAISPEHPDVKLTTVFCKHFNIKEDGNVKPYQDPHEELKLKNVLISYGSVQDTAADLQLDVSLVKISLKQSLKILYDVRKQRPLPHLDTKMIASWNGLMISAFARSGRVLSDQSYIDRAIKAANFLKDNLYDCSTKELFRSCYNDNGVVSQINDPILGFIDDYAFVIRGLIDLYEATFDPSWLILSEQLQDSQNRLFWDPEGYGFFTTREDDASIILRLKEDQDGAEPSGNSIALSNLVKLSQYLNRSDYRDLAGKLVSLFAERITKVPVSIPQMVCGLSLHMSAPKQVIVVGDKNEETTKEMLEYLNFDFRPNQITIFVDPTDKNNALIERLDALKPMLDTGVPTAYVCENFACSLPVTTREELQKLIST